MHTVIAALCTGCELCIAPCPVDCIVLVPRATLADPALRAEPAAADNRARYAAHAARARRHATRRRLRELASGQARRLPPRPLS